MAHISSKGINYENLNNEEKYVKEDRYAETKLANIHFTRHLQSKLLADDKDSKIYVSAVHPGVVKTELARDMEGIPLFFKLISIDSFKGALTQLYAAASPDIETNNWRGSYFVTYCKLAEPNAAAKDEEKVKKTWDWTEEVLQKQWKKDWKWSL